MISSTTKFTFILKATLFWFIFPFLRILTELLVDWNQNEYTKGLDVFDQITVFIWPAFVHALFFVDSLTGSTGLYWPVTLFLITVVESLLLYWFFGWVIWWGKTKNKYYWCIIPMVLFFIWYFVWPENTHFGLLIESK